MSAEPSRGGGTVDRMHRLSSLQPLMVVWLTVVWVALWGDVSIANVLSGALLALVVLLLFPLPPLPLRLRVRPVALVWLMARFLGDVVIASAQVSRTVLSFRRQPRNAVVAVTLATSSDVVLTIVAEMVSLVPGSIAVEVRRSTHTLFLHSLDVKDADGVEKVRERVLGQEHRVVRAIGVQTDRLVGPLEDDVDATESQRRGEVRS